MLDGNLYQIQEAYAHLQDHRQGEESWAKCTALKLYRRARRQSAWARVWSALTGRPCALMDLDEVRAACPLQASHHDGVRSVPINRIQGTEGRCHDFDGRFRPLRPHNKDRWVRIAMARLMRIPLPPVILMLVRDRYFVLDGHHRISVARAFGEIQIDAEITVCEFAGPLPWEQAVPARRLVGQAALGS
jgi:hypothetical protein